MAELRPEAYQSLREFAFSGHTVPNQWDYVALYDSSQTQVTRISVTSDSRFYWDDLDGDQVGKVVGTIEGADSDIPTDGTTIEYAALWDSATSGRQVTELEQLAQLTFNQDGDRMDITMNVEIPQVV